MLDESDTRSLLELLGEISGLSTDLRRKKQLLLDGLCNLVKGDGWSWSLVQQAGGRATYLGAMSGGDSQVLPKQKISSGLKSSPREIIPRSGAHEPARRHATSGTVSHKARLTLSLSLISEETISHILMGRRIGSPPFSGREEELVRIVVEEIPWLHEMNSTTETTPVRCKLPPRQQATLVLLIQGWSYKAIAAHLHVSPHTVQEYIKCIYRSFGINSRAGLIKQLALRGP